MAKEESSKKNSKTLPGLIFLIGLALIIGGVLMQIGYFDTSGGNAVPEEETTETDTDATEDESYNEDATTDAAEGTADASTVDFSITNIEDNVAIPVKTGINYTYAGAFAMIVSDFNVKCDGDVCGSDDSKVTLKFSTTDGRDYPLEFTPATPTVNLIDVPVTIEEWHQDYVVIKLTRN